MINTTDTNDTELLKTDTLATISTLLKKKNAVLVAHYYVDGDLQTLAEKTGGFVGDSLEMARFGKNTNAEHIIVAGVRFMGETAKILSPQKRVFVVDISATCSLDIGCPSEEFAKFCDAHKEREVVVYANTSAKVKAIADWMVTSSTAVDVITYLHKQGKKIIWAPDKHLGRYVQHQTNADMLLWDSSCEVHDKFKAEGIELIKEKYPDARILVHPESPIDVIAIADVVGSTTQLINEVKKAQHSTYIVATDNGIFHKMREINPTARLIEAPSRGEAADCESCAHCKWMAMNTLISLEHTLKNDANEIHIDPQIIKKAKNSIHKLLKFTKQ